MKQVTRTRPGLRQQVASALVGMGLKALLVRKTAASRSAARLKSTGRTAARSRSGVAIGVAAGLAAVAVLLLAAKRRAQIEITKSIEIEASPERVFDVWSDYGNFPRFMSRVLEVRSLGPDRSHWKVKGPADVPIEWNAVVTQREHGRLLVWRSEPRSAIEHSGRVELAPSAMGTRVTVSMSYRPPANRLGHMVASLYRRNPRQDLDHDLARMKAFIEGRTEPLATGSAGQPAPIGEHATWRTSP